MNSDSVGASLPGAARLQAMLGPRGALSTALAEALHNARSRDAGSHEVVSAITGAFDAVREIRAALEAGPSPPEQIQRIADWLKATFPHGISWAAVGPYSAAQIILEAVRGESVPPRGEEPSAT